MGTLEAGQSLTTTLSLEFIGYEVGEHSLLLTSDAISLTNPVQTTAQLTLLEPVSNPGSLTGPEQNEGVMGVEKGDDTGLLQIHLLQAQQPPTAGYRGRELAQ